MLDFPTPCFSIVGRHRRLITISQVMLDFARNRSTCSSGGKDVRLYATERVVEHIQQGTRMVIVVVGMRPDQRRRRRPPRLPGVLRLNLDGGDCQQAQ